MDMQGFEKGENYNIWITNYHRTCDITLSYDIATVFGL